MTDLALASEFPTPTREAWTALVDKVLKGADFEKRLVSRTYDGIRIEPLYPKAEAPAPVRRAAHSPWRVAQRVDHPDPQAANALALADLEGGADALVLTFAGAPAARGFGLNAAGLDELDRALSGVMLDLVSVRLEAGLGGREAMGLMLDLAERRGHALSGLDLDLGLDPIGAFAATGRMSADWDIVAGRLSENFGRLAERGFAGRLAIADGRPYHEAGGSEAQELAAVLATALAYLRALEAGGHALDRARDALSFLLVADADEFLTVAKFRALRRLWAEVEEACGLAPKPLRLHAETAWRMSTRRDPWVNLLRGTMAAFSAGIGGADAVTVLPFTAALGLPDGFARRLARNTQIILLEESNVWRVADPVAGSGAFEALTAGLAEEAWARFQEIEREGGIVASLASGALQGRIAETRSKRDAATATRRDPLTGTSEFPDIHEAPVSVLMPSSPPSSPREGEGQVTPLPSIRLAEPYERLRDRSDAVLAQTGSRPRVFLANLGPISAFSARATFAKNAFEAGGVEAVTNDGFGGLDELAAAFGGSGARLACICSSDEIYGTQAAPAAAALKAAGATAIYLAGRPGEIEQTLREAGVTDFVYVGCNLLRLLEAAQASA
ncbi:methylmalonyl-CoA mutase subunit beta [Enterovirga aerilata]|uniref:Methylmalonyl-CoA mutase n=1 Tax=Enterovirga aerilata TaxID=2730920 RepID=A0A849I028_9HYPH|nr:methylmalonyl-CoA mutase subunit beta [Enterovirga sp. DB1703]NNM72692.1 methylmalonyl-CoA mutase [Enterovirga sp. DB1703]